MEQSDVKIELVIIGGSAGSLPVILTMLKNLDESIKFAIVIVIHRKASALNILPTLLEQVSHKAEFLSAFRRYFVCFSWGSF